MATVSGADKGLGDILNDILARKEFEAEVEKDEKEPKKTEVGDYRVNPFKDPYDNIIYIAEKCYSVFGGRELWIELEGGYYKTPEAAFARIKNHELVLPTPLLVKKEK